MNSKQPSPESSNAFRAGASEQLLEGLADVTATGLPLADGLRAVAAESDDRHLAIQLGEVAARIDQGQSPEAVLRTSAPGLPRHLTGLIAASAASGDLSGALLELVDHQRSIRELWRYTWATMTYPAVLLVIALLMFVGMQVFILAPIIEIFRDFEVDLPDVTKALVWIHEQGMWWLLGLGAPMLLAMVAFRAFAGAGRWRRALTSLPLFGVLWQWSGTAELTRLLGVLTAQGIATPEALRLAAEGVRDANFRQISHSLANQVEQGRSLADCVAAEIRLPGSLTPIIGWGERTGELADACRTAADMFEGRMRLRSELLRSVVPPLLFIFIATLGLIGIFGVYAPMTSLIQGLMW